MLADTDRGTSTGLANPAAGGGVEQQDEDDQVIMVATVLSEHLLARFDQLLSRGENRPTLLFYAGLPCCAAFGLAMPFGTFLSPSIAEAVNGGDALMVVADVLCGVCVGVVCPLFSLESRRAFRADAEGPLILLGAGQQRITAAQDKTLRAFDKQANLTWGSPAAMVHLTAWTVLVACEHTHLSRFVILVYYVTSIDLMRTRGARF